MITLDIDLRPFLDFAEQMGAAANILDDELLAAVNDIADEGAEIARGILASNGSVVTEGLYNSIDGRGGSISGNTISASYGPEDTYPGKWVEEGRPPVHAKPGGYLKFQIKGSGPYLYRKSVRAAKPRPFMGPSVERLRPYANKKIGDAVMAAISKS